MLDRESWMQSFDAWLNNKVSPNTKAAYSVSWRQLLASTQKLPWQLGSQDLLVWAQSMVHNGASLNTIRLRLAAVSSFYRSLQPLGIKNPARKVHVRGSVSGRTLSAVETQAFLAAISKKTLIGKRDLALFLAYLTCSAASREIRHLQVKQILRQGERIWLVWRKYGRPWRELCTSQLSQALALYLRESAFDSADPETFVFTAWPGGKSTQVPLSISYVSHLVKKYTLQAGLASDITLRVLCRTAKEGRQNVYNR